jgi:hypothetical protein
MALGKSKQSALNYLTALRERRIAIQAGAGRGTAGMWPTRNSRPTGGHPGAGRGGRARAPAVPDPGEPRRVRPDGAGGGGR